MIYGHPPMDLGVYPQAHLREVMYYLYLPVMMDQSDILLPQNVRNLRAMIYDAVAAEREYRFVYLSARFGWATPDAPLNRPGWHCDGFGTEDLNFVWWEGPGTRFYENELQAEDVPLDHMESMKLFEELTAVDCSNVQDRYPEHHLYKIDPYVIHATPIIQPPGCWRQYIKISMSDHRYDLEGNSHNYLFDYDWPMRPREDVRNHPQRAMRDYA